VNGGFGNLKQAHTNPTNITPGQTYEYLVEVWPVGHVFRVGHRMSVKMHAPPFVDSFYAHVPRSAPGVNGAPGARHALTDHAAHGPAHRCAARQASAVRRAGSGPLRRAARLTAPQSA
jgi:predicted acyl esterase